MLENLISDHNQKLLDQQNKLTTEHNTLLLEISEK